MTSRWQFWVDRGGTFTDIVARQPDGSLVTHKLLSEDPERYADAALHGMRELLRLPADASLPADQIDTIKMGTTLGTNALLERRGARVALVITQGLRDAIRIGYQNRPDIFALEIQRPAPLYEMAIEAYERIDADGAVVTPLDEARLRADFMTLKAQGFDSLAIVFMHAYRHPAHEQAAGRIARELGFTQVSLSHEVSPLIKLVARGDTTLVDAYLSPLLADYVATLRAGVGTSRLLFMQSHGGLVEAAAFRGRDCLLSGPAGGMAGAVKISRAAGFDKLITFDMGGTSTDVAHFDGEYERSQETEIAGYRMRAPMLAIHTVAAGGGSILHFDGRRFAVGPDSAGANPGPACYRRGGPLTVTDCNVLLGKIQPEHFPAVFGPDGDLPIDADTVRERFAALTADINGALDLTRTPEEVVEGFLQIAVEHMADAIKKISLARGVDVSDYALCCFGGAGGQTACAVADALGMSRVLLHPLAGVLSAYGMGLADQRVLFEQALEMPLEKLAAAHFADLEAQGRAALAQQGIDAARITLRRLAQIKVAGSDTTLPIAFDTVPAMRAAFAEAHQRLYGFMETDKPLIVESLTVEAIGVSGEEVGAMPPVGSGRHGMTRLFSKGHWHDAPLYRRDELAVDLDIVGPALIAEPTSTIVIEPGWGAQVLARGEILLTRREALPAQVSVGAACDPVQLELFNQRFMAIAEEMGVTLQHTAHSVNIKERLDFSCAVFDGAGELIANAPHIPVHLGSMGESVKAIHARFAADMQPGDVFLLNSPYHGGTHLPDITVITPVWDEAGQSVLFYTASRGHHADVGGIAPGSMPADSTHIDQEGVWSTGLRIVAGGRFLENDVRTWLASNPQPARKPEQNLADLKAQIAANEKGAQGLRALCVRYGLETVRAYMAHALDHGEVAVREAIAARTDGAFEYVMDSGAKIAVSVRIDHATRSATLDFSGASAQQPDNFNAPAAVARAAVLYVFRTLVRQAIPLNAGCMRPLRLVIPEGSLLNPAYPAAVVAGNVETSQAMVDCLYGALGVLAASQGTMNNFTFGDAEHQYYETICGGAGAGPDFDGASAVQTHMTNSRLTDPEVLESRFPVRLEAFSIRAGSGGAGAHRGGDGVVRRLRFLAPMQVGILSGNRVRGPFGLAGAQTGQPGENRLVRAKDESVPLAGCASVQVAAGDAIEIRTPGGGGYGPPKNL